MIQSTNNCLIGEMLLSNRDKQTGIDLIISNIMRISENRMLSLLSLKERESKLSEPDENSPIHPIIKYFSKIEDTRVVGRSDHLLIEVIVIAVCAAISGANTWVDVANFGKAKEDWLKKSLGLKLVKGVPSHDTFGRVFRLIDPEQFQSAFVDWVQEVAELTDSEVIPIDGKQLRRSHDKTLGKKAIHMVSAWASQAGLVLGQVKVDDKSNEITAIPKLLDILTVSGCIITIDAMGCQKKIAAKIIDKQADYILALKGNQNGLFEDVQQRFNQAAEDQFRGCDYHKTVNKGHGRVETRQCWTLSDEASLANLHNRDAWEGLQAIVMVKSERQIGNLIQTETRYFITSVDDSAQAILHAIRTHWSIENNLHWVLDVSFREDDCRVRKGNGHQNFALLRHIALNLLKQNSSDNSGIQAKRMKAAWNDDFRLEILKSAIV